MFIINKNFPHQRLYFDCELHWDDSSPVRTFVFDSINVYTFPQQRFIYNIDNNFSTRDYILIANFIGMTLLPFALLAVLNFKLYSAIKELINDHPFLHNQPSPKNIA